MLFQVIIVENKTSKVTKKCPLDHKNEKYELNKRYKIIKSQCSTQV